MKPKFKSLRKSISLMLVVVLIISMSVTTIASGDTTVASNATRAQIVSMLYSIDGSPAVSSTFSFKDVPASSDYYNAVLWAYQNGIVNGFQKEYFAPNKYINGEEFASILYRYALYKGCANSTSVSTYSAGSYVSDYAKDAVAWAAANGLMPTTSGSAFDAQRNSTYGQVSNILDYFKVTFVDEAGKAKELPKPEDMYIDRDNYHRQVISGYYNYNCYVNEKLTRTAKFYIPGNSVRNQPTVTIVVPGGEDTWKFFVKSGWKETADKEGIFIVLAEPDNSGNWGSIKDESTYLTELSTDVGVRPYFNTFESNIYAIGYSDGAGILQENALSKPNRFAAIGLIGAPGISESKVSELQNAESSMKGVKLSQVQLPVWIVSDSKTDDVKRLVDYFKSANHSNSTTTLSPYADELYTPQYGGDVNEEWCAKVFYDEGSWKDYLNSSSCETIYAQLFYGVRRYPGNGVNFLRSFTNIYDAGFKKFTGYVAGGYEKDGSDIYNREWYVYKPESVSASKPASVVFVFHGAGGTGDEIADRSGWKKVADKYGIILVCPTGSHVLTPRNVSNMWTTELMRSMWNTGSATETRPSDIKFVDYLYKWVKENYNIDSTRVYAAGQSSGGAMTWACTLYLPKIFAASAPVSAGLVGGPSNFDMSTVDTSSLVPVCHFIGEKDPAFKNGFDDEAGKNLINYWVNRYKTVEKYDTYTYLLHNQKSAFKNGFFNNYVFNTSDGVPMLRAVEVTTSVHAIWPSECFTAWEEFFTKYTKDSNGNLYYNGKLVEIK